MRIKNPRGVKLTSSGKRFCAFLSVSAHAQLSTTESIYYPTVGQDIKKIFVPTHRAGLPDPRRGEGSPAVGRDEYFFDILSYCGIIDLSHTYLLAFIHEKRFQIRNFYLAGSRHQTIHYLSNEQHLLTLKMTQNSTPNDFTLNYLIT